MGCSPDLYGGDRTPKDVEVNEESDVKEGE